MERYCDLCYRPADKKCGACKIPYCSVEHQKLAWRHHRLSCGKDMNEPWFYQPDLSFEEAELSAQIKHSHLELENSKINTNFKITQIYYQQMNKHANEKTPDKRNSALFQMRFHITLSIAKSEPSNSGRSKMFKLIPDALRPYYSVAGFQSFVELKPHSVSHDARSESSIRNHMAFMKEQFRMSLLTLLPPGSLPNILEIVQESIDRAKAINKKIQTEESHLHSKIIEKYNGTCRHMEEMGKTHEWL